MKETEEINLPDSGQEKQIPGKAPTEIRLPVDQPDYRKMSAQAEREMRMKETEWLEKYGHLLDVEAGSFFNFKTPRAKNRWAEILEKLKNNPSPELIQASLEHPHPAVSSRASELMKIKE